MCVITYAFRIEKDETLPADWWKLINRSKPSAAVQEAVSEFRSKTSSLVLDNAWHKHIYIYMVPVETYQ